MYISADGSPAPKPPRQIEVILAKQHPTPHSTRTLVRKHEAGYARAVEWWMYMNGYVWREDG